MLATQNTGRGARAVPNRPPTQEQVDFRSRSESALGRSTNPADVGDEVERGRRPQRPSAGPSNVAAPSANTNKSRSKAKSPARHRSPSVPLPPSTPPTVQSPLRPLLPSQAPHNTIVATLPAPTFPPTVPAAAGTPALLAAALALLAAALALSQPPYSLAWP
ncbi:hypothetical protein FRC08_016039 [Ceratobasidium sp. 394]|nr:hypothetical protein FRC08_016039 [Ceratobasidium sp. 394]